MKISQCLICHHLGEGFLKIGKKWLCNNNKCAITYYQQIGWLTTNKPPKKAGRPRLHDYSSESERKAHYRQKTRDKITLNYYFKKKIIRNKDKLTSPKT